MKKTSITDPLRIAPVSPGPDFGRIGITLCPGKYDPHGNSGYWDRDVATDLDAVRAWGAAAVLTLLEPGELILLRVERLGEEVRRRHMLWFHLPIADASIPDDQFEHDWEVDGEELRSLLRRRLDVLVHCRGGLGRAGMIAARLLVELGMDPAKAIARVRDARPDTIENRNQENYVKNIGLAQNNRERRTMDWFERLTGFRETSYDATRAKLKVDGRQLKSLVNRKSYGIGELELVSLQDLRERVKAISGSPGRLRVSVVEGDVGKMHQSPENAGALFQVASQFNLLEMSSFDVTPEHGVTRYQQDHTQGPACAIAAGAATIYRNYFAPVGGREGQTAECQFDGLADLGKVLAEALNRPVQALWEMRNGYALCERPGLDAIAEYLRALKPEQIDFLRGKLRIGVHRDVEVTDTAGEHRPLVSQAFCSALPVTYKTSVPRPHWESLASLVLQAAYEATMWAAVLNAQRGASNVVLLTQLGGEQ